MNQSSHSRTCAARFRSLSLPVTLSSVSTGRCGYGAPPAAEPALKNGGKTVRLLAIGNSFSGNATRFLGDIAQADGNVLTHKFVPLGLDQPFAHYLQETAHKAVLEAQTKAGPTIANMGAKGAAVAAK